MSWDTTTWFYEKAVLYRGELVRRLKDKGDSETARLKPPPESQTILSMPDANKIESMSKLFADIESLAARLETKKAEDFAERSATTQTQTSRLAQRPWVGVEAELEQRTPVPVVTFSLRSTGATPAMDVDVEGICRPYPDSGVGLERDIKGSDYVRYIGRSVMIPGTVHKLKCRMYWGGDESSVTVYSEKTLVILRGVVTYKDVFGEAHETEFCFQSAENVLQMSACSSGNKAN